MPLAPTAAPDDLVFDWNAAGQKPAPAARVELFDETLRDGLQNPSVTDPTIGEKLELLHLMHAVGIDEADIGFPGSSPRAFEDCLRLCREVSSARLALRISCAGRTLASDLRPIIELSQRAGLPIDVYVFVGSSPIRALTERWDLEHVRRLTREAIDFVAREGLPVSYVTEDTTRSRPSVLAELFALAIERGAERLCLCDTVGQATPEGVRQLVAFTRARIAELGVSAGLDWHGHNDRGLALANALAALEAGVSRIHGTALGIGERVGNAAIELLLLNLKLSGQSGERDLSRLAEYCELAARALGWQIPVNYPLVGRDAFRTATGVHAAAISKALSRGDEWLADRVYSSVPAGSFGRRQEICVGYMSGASNVRFWLTSRNIEPRESLIRAILQRAKASRRILSDDELLEIVVAETSLLQARN